MGGQCGVFFSGLLSNSEVFRFMSKKRKASIVPYFFILPAFIVHACLVAAPSLSTLVMSLYDWNGLGNPKYIGLNMRDPTIKLCLIHNLEWLAIFITVPIILGFAVSILVSQLRRFQMFLRTVYFVPYVISAVVAGRIWTAFMNPYYGLNLTFGKMGLEGMSKTLWLGNPKIALFSVAFVDNWHWWGFIMVLFLGALQQVDTTLYEAARVDGANRWQELLHVSIPGIRSTIAFVLIMTIMWSFLTFDYVYVMTNGGPANSTEILATYIYKNAFFKYRAGYANAICVLQSGLCIFIYFLEKFISKKGGLEDE